MVVCAQNHDPISDCARLQHGFVKAAPPDGECMAVEIFGEAIEEKRYHESIIYLEYISFSSNATLKQLSFTDS